ncbi:hypothetical protein ACHAXA_000090 [Cyclostephanos tholiformis]|uniref:Uncharacterized protein n=1 Tax=Cyclostephanos tholiformis TaxID=382380 RepID=A0ABD3RW43_9STRA
MTSPLYFARRVVSRAASSTKAHASSSSSSPAAPSSSLTIFSSSYYYCRHRPPLCIGERQRGGSHNLSSSSSSSSSSSNDSDKGRVGHEMTSKEEKKKKTNVTASAADRRLAGRRRFYADVGVVPTSPPPFSFSSSDSSTSSAAMDGTTTITTTKTLFVESPISAGVDGTNSASGVTNNHTTTTSDSDRWAAMLVPPRRRRRGSNPNDDDVEAASSWYGVTLDGRTLRTPLGRTLSLPSLPLAIAVASEWDSQVAHVRPAQMPLMTLCCTAIDQVASNPTAHRNDVLSYLYNDTSCYMADPNDMNDRGLYRRQSRAYMGLHDYDMTRVFGLPFGHDLRPAIAYGEGEALTLCRRPTSSHDDGNGSRMRNGDGDGGGGGGSSRSGLPHPPLLITRAVRYVDSLDAWTLAALYSACAESKSFFIGAALIHEAMGGGDGRGGGGEGNGDDDDESGSEKDCVVPRDARWASDAARVEEEFNIECWGLVEGGHDYDRLNCSIQMHAASFLARTVASG